VFGLRIVFVVIELVIDEKIMEETNNVYEDLMIRILDGVATEKEKATFEQWLKEKPANQAAYQDFQKIWMASPDAKLLAGLDVNADLAAVKAKSKAAQQPAKTARVIALPMLQKVAAILLPIAVVVTALFLYINQADSNAPILLSDGTKVWLYKTAKLDFPKSFEGENRLVKLTGEAYFDVAKDANKPFIIEAGKATIQVLGTSFNVQSSATETKVVVNSGKVQLADKINREKTVELTKGEKGIYANAQVVESINTDKNYRSWHTGVFEFDGTVSMEVVVQQLSKYYGQVDLNIAANETCLLDASFEKEELKTVLEVIKNSCGYQ